MNYQKLIFSVVAVVIVIFIFVAGVFSYFYFTSEVLQEKQDPLYFQEIPVEDHYNNTFHLDVTFETENPEYLVREKIYVHAKLHRINKSSDLRLSIIYFALVTAEGHTMPFQKSHKLGWLMEDDQEERWSLYYNTTLDLSEAYCCRLTFCYFNLSDIPNLEWIYDEVFTESVLEIQPRWVALQIRWMVLQIEAANKTTALALLVVILALITILVTWIEKYDRLVKKWNSFKTR